MALSAIWIGAVIDSANQIPVRGTMAATWPDSEIDADVDATTALRRRGDLAASTVRELAAAHPRVGSVCVGKRPGTATVFAVGDKSIVAVETTLVVEALKRGQLLPTAPVTTTVIPIVGDVRATFEPIAKQRQCVPVEHADGVVDFDAKRLSLRISPRKVTPALGAPCADDASIVAAAQQFADVLGGRSRDTVRALPQPFAHPAVVKTAQAGKALTSMTSVPLWTGDMKQADTQMRRADSAMLIVKNGADGTAIGAQVVLRAPTTSIRIYLQILDGTCRLSDVPSSWYAHGDASPATSPLISRWQRNGAAWTKAAP